MKITNFRGLKKVFMITVLEGNGTAEDVSREVHYIYDDEAQQMVGKIDPPTGRVDY